MKVKNLILVVTLVCLLKGTCLAAAFTTVSPHDDLQNITIHNELLLSWDERRQAIGQTALDKNQYSVNDDIQWYTNYYMIQKWMEDYCTSFVDTNAVQTNGQDFVFWNLTSFRNAMGQSSGFRKGQYYDENTSSWVFDHGLMAYGDPIGWWLFQDMQEGFKALIKTGPWSSLKTNLAHRTWTTDITTYSWANALSDLATEWANRTTWAPATYMGPSDVLYLSYVYAWNRESGSWPAIYTFDVFRYRGQPVITNLYTGVPHTAKVYMVLTNNAAIGWSGTFTNIDNLGAHNGKLWCYETLAQSSKPGETGSMIGDFSTDPANAMSVPDPGPLGNAEFLIMNWSTSGHYPVMWLLEWAFTYR